MTDPIRQYIDTHIPENHRQGDGCWDAAQRAMDQIAVLPPKWFTDMDATLDARAPLDVERRVTIVCDLLWANGVYLKDSLPLARVIVAALAAEGSGE